MNCLRSTSESAIKRAPVRTLLLDIVLILAVLHLWSAGLCAQAVIPGSPSYRIEAARWEAAEKIFRSDPRWLGGDGAASVDLGHGRVLWLFGDSFIDPSGSGSRRTSDLVRNSIAVQTGYDPTNASMQFAWKMKDGKPAAFFARQGENWFWPASGIMVGNRLLIFLMEVGTAGNELGFEARGWKAVLINNPQEGAQPLEIDLSEEPAETGPHRRVRQRTFGKRIPQGIRRGRQRQGGVSRALAGALGPRRDAHLSAMVGGRQGRLDRIAGRPKEAAARHRGRPDGVHRGVPAPTAALSPGSDPEPHQSLRGDRRRRRPDRPLVRTHLFLFPARDRACRTF